MKVKVLQNAEIGSLCRPGTAARRFQEFAPFRRNVEGPRRRGDAAAILPWVRIDLDFAAEAGGKDE
jgi:hypothetical protein